MFVLTPPSELTSLDSSNSVTYSSFLEDWTVNNKPSKRKVSKCNCCANISFNCCNLTSIGSLIASSVNDITYWKLCLFCLYEWNFYTTMKIIYPFDEYLATYYGIPLNKFSLITSSYDCGSFITILFILIPCIHFNKISIRIALGLIFIFNGIIQLTHTISASFTMLFVIRLTNGILGALAWSQITGSIGAFLKNKNKRTFAIIIHESSALFSTLSFVPIGYILYAYSINLCWKILSGISFFCAISSFCVLPKISVYNASHMHQSSKRIMNNNSMRNNNNNKHKYHLYLLYLVIILTQFPYIMFYSTFGPDLTHRFDLNAQTLGLQTLTINGGEFTALIVTILFIKYYSNSFFVLFGSFGVVFASVFYAIVLDMKVYNEILILILIYFYALFKDIIILNSIICTLHFSPNGYESICSLIFLLFMNLSSMIGTIIGPDIVNKTSFAVLSRVNAIIFLMQLLVAWNMMIQRNIYQRKLGNVN